MGSHAFGVVIVGAGLMGRWHAQAAARAGARVLAVVDPDLARAQALARRHADCAARPTLDAALADSHPQVVHLCTPTGTHESLTTRSLEAGAHVLVEKPLAADAASTRRLLELADARQRLLCPVHQFVFQRGVLQLAEWLPRIGAIRHVDLAICSAGAEGVDAAVRDQIAIDVLPHPFALLARFLGQRFERVSWHVATPAPGELRLSGSDGAVTAGILVSMSGRPTMNVLRVIAERGTAHADLFHGFATLEHGTVSRTHKIVRPFAVASASLMAATTNLARRLVLAELAYPGLSELVGRFMDAVRHGRPSPISASETLAVAAARDAVLAHSGALMSRR
jgi:predicted dehydrogenase